MSFPTATLKKAPAGVVGLTATLAANAGNLGSDLNLTLTAAWAASAAPDSGRLCVRQPGHTYPTRGRNRVYLGVSHLFAGAHADHDGAVVGAPCSADSRSDRYPVPRVGVQQRAKDRLVFGGGPAVTTGLGSDFRNATPIGPKVALTVFGAGYDVTPGPSVGASTTLGFGLPELGLIANIALTTSFELSGIPGVIFVVEPALRTITSNSPMRLEFDKVPETAPGQFSDFELEQPQEVIDGAAASPMPVKNLLLEAKVIGKNRSYAGAHEDIWDDRLVGASGGQYDLGKVNLRAGYIFWRDFLKPGPGSSIGNIRSLAFQGSTLPLSTAPRSIRAGDISPGLLDSAGFSRGWISAQQKTAA